MTNSILWIALGGTIAAEEQLDEYENKETLLTDGKKSPANVIVKDNEGIKQVLEKLNRNNINTTPIIDEKYDSKDLFNLEGSFKEEFKKKIITSLSHSSAKEFLITCGTDRMPDIARSVKDVLLEQGLFDIKVIITGSMKPLSHGRYDETTKMGSKGFENLEVAVNSFKKVAFGVHVVMDRVLWEVDEKLGKDMNRREFYGTYIEPDGTKSEYYKGGKQLTSTSAHTHSNKSNKNTKS